MFIYLFFTISLFRALWRLTSGLFLYFSVFALFSMHGFLLRNWGPPSGRAMNQKVANLGLVLKVFMANFLTACSRLDSKVVWPVSWRICSSVAQPQDLFLQPLAFSTLRSRHHGFRSQQLWCPQHT